MGVMRQKVLDRRALFFLLVAGLFLLVNGLSLSFVRYGGVHREPLGLVAVWFFVSTVVLILFQRYAPRADFFILAIYLFLSGWGLLLQARLAPAFIGRHFVWYLLGTALVVIIAMWIHPLEIGRNYRYTLLIAGILLLAITLLAGVNPTGFGAELWLRLPIPRINAYFQPSELLKLLLIFFFASYFADRGRGLVVSQTGNWRESASYLLPLLLMWGFCVILLIWQRDLGAATLFFVLFVVLLYTATGRKHYITLGALLLIIAGVIGYRAFGVVALRIDTWWNPWPEFNDRGFQIIQSLYALTAGGALGQGMAQGYPTFIPVVHSDFVLAAIGEEWGLLGLTVVLACFAVFTQRGLRIAMLNNNTYSLYLALGITTLLTTQTLLICGGVTKLLPLTGVTLPFVSYGGSSFLVSCIMVGVLLYLSTTTD